MCPNGDLPTALSCSTTVLPKPEALRQGNVSDWRVPEIPRALHNTAHLRLETTTLISSEASVLSKQSLGFRSSSMEA